MHDRRHDRNAAESRVPDEIHPPEPHDRRHDLAAASGGHAGERDVTLSARSLAARGDAPDGSEDGRRDDADE